MFRAKECVNSAEMKSIMLDISVKVQLPLPDDRIFSTTHQYSLQQARELLKERLHSLHKQAWIRSLIDNAFIESQ